MTAGLVWKRGRGLLGPLAPLIGRWQASDALMPDGTKSRCTRCFCPFGKSYVRLEASWEFESAEPYREVALFGKGDEGALAFWSFTSDGKRSQGAWTDAAEIHPLAIGFCAQMQAGTARMVYWPAEEEGTMRFAVERKTARGWSRFLDHLYVKAI
jgi:hypothetical protein